MHAAASYAELVTAPYSSTVITENGNQAPTGTARVSASLAGAARTIVRQPLLLAGLGSATISCSPVLVVLSGASAVSTAFYRSAIALPVLIVIAVIEQRRHGRRSLAQRVRAGVAGAFLAVDLILWTHAIADVGAGVATVLGNLQVLIVAGFTWLIWRERPRRAVIFALPVVMLGVVLVSGLIGKPGTGQHPLAGILYGLGTSVAYAGFLMILRRSSTDSVHVAGPVADSTAGATITSLVIGLFIGGLGLHPVWPSIGWLIVLGLVSQVSRLADDRLGAAETPRRRVVPHAAAPASGLTGHRWRGHRRAADPAPDPGCRADLHRRPGGQPRVHPSTRAAPSPGTRRSCYSPGRCSPGGSALPRPVPRPLTSAALPERPESGQ